MITLIEFDRNQWDYQVLRAEFNGIPWAVGFTKHLDPAPESQKFWLGEAYYDIPQSELLAMSRVELWKLLNDQDNGLPRYFFNISKEVRRGRLRRRQPGENVDSRVCALLRAALFVVQERPITLLYEGDRTHAEMVARCIEWVANVVRQHQ
jgi:hypothetical protein